MTPCGGLQLTGAAGCEGLRGPLPLNANREQSFFITNFAVIESTSNDMIRSARREKGQNAARKCKSYRKVQYPAVWQSRCSSDPQRAQLYSSSTWSRPHGVGLDQVGLPYLPATIRPCPVRLWKWNWICWPVIVTFIRLSTFLQSATDCLESKNSI